jgi:hypothetical protein
LNLDDYKESARVKALVYGPPKSGKTALVGKLAQHFTLHWLDLEKGIKTLLNPAMLAPAYRKNVNVITVPDHRMYPVAIDTVRAVLKGGLRRICFAHGKVNCPLCTKLGAEARWSEIDILKFTDKDVLVIDSLSQLSASAMNKVTYKEITKPGGEEYKATFNDYAQQGALLEEVLSLIQVIDLNVVCISHAIDSEKADSSKEAIVPLAGTRNASKLAAKYFDEVVYVSVLNKKHSAFNSTTASTTILTGGRSGATLDGQKDDAISLLPLFERLGVIPASKS